MFFSLSPLSSKKTIFFYWLSCHSIRALPPLQTLHITLISTQCLVLAENISKAAWCECSDYIKANSFLWLSCPFSWSAAATELRGRHRRCAVITIVVIPLLPHAAYLAIYQNMSTVICAAIMQHQQ